MADEPSDSADGPGGERAASPAVYASNWKTVLLVDAAVGFAVFVVGLAVIALWNLYVGAFIGSLGLVYVLLVARRARHWVAWRREAGL